MFLTEDQVQAKWKPLLESADLPPIKDAYRRNVTARILENTEAALRTESAILNETSPTYTAGIPANFMGASSSTAGSGGIDTFDPVLISLVRRAAPNLIAYDICGVQPMSGPTGLIFAMRSRYSNQTGSEAFYNEANTAYSTVALGNSSVNLPGYRNVGTLPGNTTNQSNLAETNTYNYAAGVSTAQLEAFGTDGNSAFPEMAFTIEKVTVTAKARALKAEYTLEIAQDLKALHGLEAETELSNMLSTEILADINREVVRTINVTAVKGADQGNTTTDGIFDLDTDSNGRWSVEKFKGLMFQIERDCNSIAKQTRRGRGNMMICSSDVASALRMAGVLSNTPALNQNNNVTVDDTGTTFIGTINGIKVFIDPYVSGGNYYTAGYKGVNAFDAGLFYCPYVPLQMLRGMDPHSMQPKIGFKTRYGMVSNPFAQGATTTNPGALLKDSNVYYRRVLVTNLL